MHAGFGFFLSTQRPCSHLHWPIPIIVGIIVAAAVSISKPLIGILRQFVGETISLASAAATSILYFMLRMVDYVILERWDPTLSPRSRIG